MKKTEINEARELLKRSYNDLLIADGKLKDLLDGLCEMYKFSKMKDITEIQEKIKETLKQINRLKYLVAGN